MDRLFNIPFCRPNYITNLASIGRLNGKDSNLPQDHDVIIVGGGTAGCALAARLTENPQIRVLVLEAGGSGVSNLLTRIPPAYPLLFHTGRDYDLYTEPQKHAHNRPRYWPRGKMLGGCSSLNSQVAHYGAPSDFDEWAEVIGDTSWSWAQISQFFRKAERYEYDPNFPDVEVGLKGSHGPMRVGYFPVISTSSQNFVKACIKVGIPYSADFTQPIGVLGVNKLMTYVDEKRERVSSESAYFTQDVLARPNLRVATHATVTRVLFAGHNGKFRAVGVEFARSKKGTRYQARAKRDIILCAGAIHTPHLLLLSGVGPATHLQERGIPIIYDISGVGDHLVDHPVVDLYFKDRLNASTKHIKPNGPIDFLKFLGSAARYLISRTGALASNITECAAFLRSDDPILFSDLPALKDSTPSRSHPDLEIFSTPFAYKEHGGYMFPMHTFSLHAVLLKPLSKGTLRLKSSDPFENPVVDPNYLEAPEDVERLIRCLKFISKVVKAEPLVNDLDLECHDLRLDSDIGNKSDEQLAELIRERVETVYHPTSTCRMAPLERGGVVDSKLSVYGVEGLRVCDASIFTEIIAGHTSSACLAVAEKLSDQLKEEYFNSVSSMLG